MLGIEARLPFSFYQSQACHGNKINVPGFVAWNPILWREIIPESISPIVAPVGNDLFAVEIVPNDWPWNP